MYSIHQGVWLTVVVYVEQCVGQGYFLLLVNILDLSVHRWWETMDWNLAGYSVEKQGLLKDHATVFACLNPFTIFLTTVCVFELCHQNLLKVREAWLKLSVRQLTEMNRGNFDNWFIMFKAKMSENHEFQVFFVCFSILVNWIDLRIWQVVRQTKKFEDDTLDSDTISQIEKLNRQLYWQLFRLENLII